MQESSEGFDQFKARIVKPDKRLHIREKSLDGENSAYEGHLYASSDNSFGV